MRSNRYFGFLTLLYYTECPKVSVPTLIEDCALILRAMTKSFDPMKEGLGILLMYDKPLCSQNYSGSG